VRNLADKMTTPAVAEFLRPTSTADHPAGVYRVVGTREQSVTLLRVGDSDGTRIVTGEVVTVDRDDLAGFEPADEPERDRSVAESVVAAVEHVYWSLRAFGQQLARHPLASTVTLAVVAVAFVGESVLPFPNAVFSGLAIVGGLGLALLGSGRL
jgi:hypothetical protein